LQSATRPNTAQPFDTAYGTPDDLDQLVVEAGRHKIRILVDLPLGGPHTAQEVSNVARFWLSHGVAGLRLLLESGNSPSPAQLTERLRDLKRLAATYAGDRVLFWNLPSAPPLPDATQLTLSTALEQIPRLDADSLRHALANLPPVRPVHTTVLVTDGIDRPRSFDRYGSGSDDVELAKVLATALLAGPGAPLLYFGQEIGMATTPAPGPDKEGHNHAGDPTPMQWGDERGFSTGVPWIDMGRNAATANVAMEEVDRYSLLNWYRRLTALRHAKAVLRDGSADVLQLSNPSVVAWIRRTKVGSTVGSPVSSPVIAICNLSAHPVSLSIASELRRLAVPAGSGVMHTLATSNTPASADASAADRKPEDPAYDAPVSINAISLPPYGVYLGELRGQAGLETMPSPTRSRSSTRAKTGR